MTDLDGYNRNTKESTLGLPPINQGINLEALRAEIKSKTAYVYDNVLDSDTATNEILSLVEQYRDSQKVKLDTPTYKYTFHTYWYDPQGYYVNQAYIDMDVKGSDLDEARTKVFAALKGSDTTHGKRLAAKLLKAEEM